MKALLRHGLYILLVLIPFYLHIRGEELQEFIASRQVYVYRAYKDMQIFHFSVPPLTSFAKFNLTSNITDSCDSRNITVYLQADSYPVVSPDGAEFPEQLWIDRQKVYQATLLSNLKPVYLDIVAPQPGDWFMVGFIFDDSNRITQAGLFRSCYAWLQTEVKYSTETNIVTLQPNSTDNENFPQNVQISELTYFSFYVPVNTWSVEVQLSDCNLDDNRSHFENVSTECYVEAFIRPLALPYDGITDTLKFCFNESFKNGTCHFQFTPAEGKWHYLSLAPLDGNLSLSVIINLIDCKVDFMDGAQSNGTLLTDNDFLPKDETTEIKLAEAFEHLNISTNEALLNHMGRETTSDDVYWQKLDVNDPPPNNRENDQNVAVAKAVFHQSSFDEDEATLEVKNVVKRSVNVSSEFNDTLSYDLDDQVIVDSTQNNQCWRRHNLIRRTFPGNFVFEYDLKPKENGLPTLMMNLSNHSPTSLSFMLQPITDIGGTLSVDLAISPFLNVSIHNHSLIGCLTVNIRGDFEEVDGSLRCVRGKTIQLNTTSLRNFAESVMIPYPEPGIWFLTLFPSCYLRNASEPVQCHTNVTAIIFGVSSASCLMGKCGKFGSCYQYISGGFIFSTCVCSAGHRGWGCNDAAASTPRWKLLLSTLLLTLSNLCFIPAIILALYRRYITEALIYSITMFFSAFYHACDEDIYDFCLMPLNVLQFGDFYSAILSFWVTLITMAKLPQQAYSLLYMAGAVAVALGVEYDKTGLWVFALPSISAFCIMATAWIFRSRHSKRCYPPRNYWLKQLLPGTVLAVAGLICYAFFETEDNYYLIHSLWHSSMALSILCLLPERRVKKDNLIEIRNSDEDGDLPSSDAQALTGNHNL